MSEKVKVFYDKLPKLIEDVVAQMGRFQYAVAFMLCFNSAIIAMENVVTTCYSYQPNFLCKNLQTNQCSPNETCTDGYAFDDEDHTVVSEWSLICNREHLVPLISTLYFTGMAIGAFVCGLFSDRFGRKPTLLICLYAQGVLGLCLSIIYDINWFIALRFLQGFFVQGVQTCLYTLLMEYSSATKRTVAGLSSEIMWAVGLLYLAFAVRDWWIKCAVKMVGLFEMFVFTSMYFALAKFGRTKSTMICLCVNGILLVAIGVCSSYKAEDVVQISDALLARGISSALFYVNFVQANELFPTITRGCAFGICGLTGKCGNILAPFILPLAQHVSPLLPMTILGVLSILSGLAQYFLPETLNIQTPNSVADAQKIWE